jgi:hypothetical protein
LKNLAQDTTTNANGSSQDARTSPVVTLPHGGSEPTLTDAALCTNVGIRKNAQKYDRDLPMALQ